MRAHEGAAENAAAPSVVLTDAETRAVVAACRGLHQAGFRVAAVAGTVPAPGLWSRSVSEREILPHPLEEEEAFVAQLERLVASRRHDLLVPGSDASLLAISRRRERLEPHIRLGLPPHDVVERSLDKRALLDAAQDAAVGEGDVRPDARPGCDRGAPRLGHGGGDHQRKSRH